MKLISIGIIDYKYLLYFIFYILITISLNCLAFFKFGDISKYKISLLVIIQYSALITFLIPEIIINRKFQNIFKKQNKGNKIKYIFKDFSKKSNLKNISLDILSILFFLLLAYILLILEIEYSPTSKLVFNENYYFVSLFFLFISTHILYKKNFFSHHFLSVGMIIIIGLTRYILKIVVFHSPNFTFPFDLILLFFLLVIAFFEAFLQVYMKLVMEFRFYSPFFISSMIGIICSFIAVILLIILNNVECSFWFCEILNQDINFEYETSEIICLVIYSILNGLHFFIQLMVINIYTPCHLFLLLQSKEFIINIFTIIDNWDIGKFILILVTFICEIFASFVYMEMIEFNFCGFDTNLRTSISERADSDVFLTNDDDKKDGEDEIIEMQTEVMT